MIYSFVPCRLIVIYVSVEKGFVLRGIQIYVG